MVSIDTLSVIPAFVKISELEESCLRVAVVRSALELGLFDAIAGGATSGELAHHLGADERALGILLDVLCTQGFLDKRRDRYHLEHVAAAYLARGSESYYGRSCLELTLCFEAAGRLTETVRHGRPRRDPDSAQGAGDLWAADLAPHLTLWPVMAEQARTLWWRIGIGPGCKGLRVLDMACGAGVHILALLQDDPAAADPRHRPPPRGARGDAAGRPAHGRRGARSAAHRRHSEERLRPVELRPRFLQQDPVLLRPRLGRGRLSPHPCRALRRRSDRRPPHLVPDEERQLRTAPTLLAVEVAGFRDPRSEGEDLVWATR